jgi:hypothetical protein
MQRPTAERKLGKGGALPHASTPNLEKHTERNAYYESPKSSGDH